jgi:hypothetical protein
MSASGGGRFAFWASAREPAKEGTMFLPIQDTALCAVGQGSSTLRRAKAKIDQ